MNHSIKNWMLLVSDDGAEWWVIVKTEGGSNQFKIHSFIYIYIWNCNQTIVNCNIRASYSERLLFIFYYFYIIQRALLTITH